ncbi:Cytidine deaminase [Bacteroides pyogenes]|nr:Cytidine deaminase [Bacteroides pyogenes]SUV35684.1 cytidine deaminase [Bacteroides pyogenes]
MKLNINPNSSLNMKELAITAIIKAYQLEELNEADRMLVKAAMDATKGSYAPYSRFSVGAAARLKNGTIVTGSNQENAAYPSGICAERTTLFYANSQYPDQPVDALAVAARTEQDFLEDPIPPCGACRQVILETEKRYGQPLRILLFGKKHIYEIKTIGDLLPLSFEASAMEIKS